MAEEPSITIDKEQNTPDNLPLENYKARYVELSKQIAGAFLGSINYELALTTNLSESYIILIGNTIAHFIAWLLGEKIIHPICVSLKCYTESKSKNPLYRNFKTLASLGNSIGIIATITATSLKKLKLNITTYAAYSGLILGLFAFAYRYYRQSIQAKQKNKQNTDALIGAEGWSKYTKLALVFGTFMGQIIGGCISYNKNYDALTSWSNITLYGAVVSVISFFSMMLLVPIINYLTRNKHKSTKGILVSENKDIFNTSYMRSGMTLGVCLGSILGSLLAPLLLAGVTPTIGIAVVAGVFAIIGGIILGACGQHITLYLQKHWHIEENTDNSWSYATRNTSYVFGFIGTAIACIFCPGAALLQTVAIGSAISGLVGWFLGLGLIWTARQIKPKEQKVEATELPWTQRISLGANRGSIIGSVVGLIIGLFAGGALGLIGLILLCGALGAILGSLKEGLNHSAPKAIIEKVLYQSKNTTSTKPIMTEPKNEFNVPLSSSLSAPSPKINSNLPIKEKPTLEKKSYSWPMFFMKENRSIGPRNNNQSEGQTRNTPAMA